MRELTDSGCPWVGKIPENWTVKKVKFLIESGENGMKIGPYGSALKGKTLSDGPVKIYNQANLIADDFDFARHFISEESYKELQNYTINAGDILFSMMGTIGKCKIMPDNKPLGIMDSHLLKARLNEEILPRFFVYAFDKDLNPITLEQLIFKSNGSIMNGLNSTVVKTTELAIPPISEQHAIVAYLDEKCAAIDESIQKRKEIIEKLKEYRKAVITRAVTKGLDPNTEMKDSGTHWIGLMPAKWNSIRVKQACWLKGRIGWDGLKAKEFTDEGPYLITGTDFQEGYINWNTCAHITEERYNEDELLHIKEGDLLITKAGPIGKLAIVKNCPEKVSLNSGVMIIRSNNTLAPYKDKFMYYVLSSDEFWDWYNSVKKPDSTISHLYQNQFYEFRFAYPSIDEQEKISAYLDEKCRNIDAMISKQQTIIDKLEEYKKSIIYNAVTGKIDCRTS